MSDYAVGKGKPPKHSQWKPGQCGNPNKIKKPKPPKTFLEQLSEETQVVMSVKQGGAMVKMTRQRAIILRLINGALAGDVRCLRMYLEYSALAQNHSADVDQPEVSEADYKELLAILREQQELPDET